MKLITSILAISLSLSSLLGAADDSQRSNNTGPIMGWNSWNWHGKKEINENVVRETIDAMVSTGLRDAGYNYIVIDGGWRGSELAPNGELTTNAVRFPGGIKPLVDYAHANGMKLGVHTVPGSHDCGGDPVGGFGREEVHVAQFAEWGLDFVKLDRCVMKTEAGWNEAMIESAYRKWADLIEESGQDMVLSISAYEYRDWYPELCSMARTTLDIDARVKNGAIFDREVPTKNHLSVMTVADLNNRYASKAGNGYWNDSEMLVTGEQGLTEAEQEAHFALWCVMSSPLFLGNDPRNMTPFELALLTNRAAIEINQDPTEQGRRIVKSGMSEVWLKRMGDGRMGLLLLNRGADQMRTIEFDVGGIAAGARFDVLNVFSGAKEQSDGTFSVELEPRSAQFYLVSPR